MQRSTTNPFRIVLSSFMLLSFPSIDPAHAQEIPRPKKDQPVKRDPTKDKDRKAIDRFQREIQKYLGKLDPNANVADVREELYTIVEQFAVQLRPAKGTKTYVSSDRSFILAIAANGVRSDGEDAKVENAGAGIVMAVGGNGNPRGRNRAPASSGGSAVAVAPKGIGIALAGRGGRGGGGGGGTNGQGGIGSMCLGGSGGPGIGLGGRGGDGGGRGIKNAEAIANAFR